MNGNVSFIEIGTSDHDRSRPFFEKVFGWQFHSMSQGGGWFQTPTIRIGLHGNDPNPQLYTFFEVPDLNLAIAAVRQAGGLAEDASRRTGVRPFLELSRSSRNRVWASSKVGDLDAATFVSTVIFARLTRQILFKMTRRYINALTTGVVVHIRLIALLGLTLTVGISACTVTAQPARIDVTEVVVARPPPPPRPEPIPPPPPTHPELTVWQPGHWHWNGHDYEWHPGHYEKRPATNAVWVPAEWVPRNGQYVFRPGHWDYH